jgi:hypothetical protein
MAEKLKLYFHIGQPKTGSSAIQAFLNYNREKLAKEFGVLYPNFGQKDLGTGFYHNHGLISSQFQSVDNYKEYIHYFIECQQYCLAHKIYTVIISWEGFQNQMWPGFISLIEKTLNIEVKIILYLRRQDLYYESSWKQWGHKYPEIHSIQDFIVANDKDHLNYLKNWIKYFIPEQFILRTYEKSCIGNDVVIDFLKILGIKDKTGFVQPPENNLNTNAGLTPEVIEILRLSKYMVGDENDNKMLDMAYNILSERFKKRDPFKTYGFLTLEERLQIMEKYKSSNREVARIFFGDERQELFLDPIDEKDVQPVFQGLTIENTVPVLMELLFHQYEAINSIKAEIERLSNIYANNFLSDRLNTSFIEIDLEEFVSDTVSSHQVTDKNYKDDGLIFTAISNDPCFIFTNPIPSHEIKALAFTITTPGKTIFQVFYNESEEMLFSEEKSLTRPVLKGKSSILLLLPEPTKINNLRIDPGTIDGKYIIHQIQIAY